MFASQGDWHYLASEATRAYLGPINYSMLQECIVAYVYVNETGPGH